VGFIAWIKKKKELKLIFPSINTITKEYYSYKEKHQKATYEEALLHAIRWRFNRAFFGTENPFYGSKIYGEFSDAKIVRILKENNSFMPIEKAAAFVAGLEIGPDGIEPLTWMIARQQYHSFGRPWRPKTIEEMERRCWMEMEVKGVVINLGQTKVS